MMGVTVREKVKVKLKGSDLAGKDGKRTFEYQALYNPHEYNVDRLRIEEREKIHRVGGPYGKET